MKTLTLYFSFFLFLFLFSCGSDNDKEDHIQSKTKRPVISKESYKDEPIDFDLDEIKESGELVALTMHSPSNYFLYKGKSMGFEYELLENFAKHIGVEFKIKMVNNLDSIIPMLNSGEGDIIAHGFTITDERKSVVDFTNYYYLIHQVLVQRKPHNWRKMTLDHIDDRMVKDVVDLIGKTVSVRRESSYYERLGNLSREIGGEINVNFIPGTLSTDEIIHKVAKGEIEYTFADNNIADINKSYYPLLDVSTPVSLSQRVAWSVRKDSDDLKEELNSWLKGIKRSGFYNIIYKKYFLNKRQFKKRMKSEYFSIQSGSISEYDDIVKKYSDKIDWDWRLLSSLIYQESRFDHYSKSWAGAKGLMQLMPRTAKSLGLRKNTPSENLKAGTKYLDQIYNDWEEIPDSIQRIKFTMASYNCGYYHVRDAQNLAKVNNADYKSWDDGVDKYILKLAHAKYYNMKMIHYGYVRGLEPYNYVREVFDRYENYKEFIEE